MVFGFGTEARDDPPTQEPLSLTLRCATPHAFVDPVVQRILQARERYRALCADPLRGQHPDPVAREEQPGVHAFASASTHPLGVHLHPRSEPGRFADSVTRFERSVLRSTYEGSVEHL